MKREHEAYKQRKEEEVMQLTTQINVTTERDRCVQTARGGGSDAAHNSNQRDDRARQVRGKSVSCS